MSETTIHTESCRRLPAAGPLLVAQVRYQLRTMLRTPRAISTGMVLPVLLLILSGTAHGTLSAARLAGLAVLGLTMTAWTTHGIAVVTARETGLLRRWRATPLPAWCYFTGRITATVLVAVGAGAVTIAVGVVVYGTRLGSGGAVAVVLTFAVGALACAATATAVTGLIPTIEAAWPILGLAYLPVVLVSGAIGTVHSQPGWLSTLADYLPVRPMVTAVGSALGHSAGASVISVRDLLVLGLWAAGGLLVATALFRWEPTRSHERRTPRSTGARGCRTERAPSRVAD